MHVCFFTLKKVRAGWWHDSPGVLEMHISLKMHIFIGFCPTSGLFRESGAMAGWQQAPAGNHRLGHLGRAGRNEKFFWVFFLTTLLLLSFTLSLCCWIEMFLSTCCPHMHKTLDLSRGGGKSGSCMNEIKDGSKYLLSRKMGQIYQSVTVGRFGLLKKKSKKKEKKEITILLYWFFTVRAIT